MESTILAVYQETPDTVRLRIESSMHFVPGQFIMLGSRVPGGPDREVKRSYSLSAAHNGEWIEVTVKQQSPGFFSAYAQKLAVGEKINVYGPFGHHFTWQAHTHQDMVFIAGGSGIAPFRSMLQTAVSDGFQGAITILYSVKTSQDIIYRNELEEFAKKLNCKLIVTLTRPTDDDGFHWKGSFGRVSGKLLKDTIGSGLVTKHFLVCGPTPLVNDVEALLAHLGVPEDSIMCEKYGAIEG